MNTTISYQVTICIRGDLNFFLYKNKAQRRIRQQCHDRRAVKDIIEACGVPHVEVASITVNHQAESFDYILKPDDYIVLYPFHDKNLPAASRPLRPRFTGIPCFVIDVHLYTLAKKLRLLGFDVDYASQRDDVTLAMISSNEQRVLLSRDRQLLMRKNVTYGMYIRHTNPDMQLREVVARYKLFPYIKPYTRCMLCNNKLRTFDKNSGFYQQVALNIPQDVRTWCNSFFYCDYCQKIYWKGSHTEKMDNLIQSLTP